MQIKVTNLAPKTSDKDLKKRAKFVELAERRTIGAIKSIRVIGKLGNPSAYDYNDADIKKIVAALNKEIEDLKAKFARRSTKESIEFKL